MRLDKCRTGSCCARCCHMTLSAACPVTGREFAWKLACAPVSAGSLAYTDTTSNQPETLQTAALAATDPKHGYSPVIPYSA